MHLRRPFPAAVALASALALAAMAGGHWRFAWTAAAIAALAGMCSARRTAAAQERARWTWWAAAAGAWLAGQIAADVYTFTGAPPSPNLADAGWLSFALLAMAGLIGTRRSSLTLRAVAIAESLPLMLAGTALTFALLWPDACASALPLTGRLSALAYPGLYVTAAVLILQAVVSGSLHGIRDRAVLLVLAGTISQAIGFVVYGHELLDSSFAPGAVATDSMFVIGLLAMGAGGLLVRDGRGGSAPAAGRRDLRGILPAATFLLLLGAQVRAGFRDEPLGTHIALTIGVTTAAATLIARSALLARSQRELLHRERDARIGLAERETELARLNERLSEDSRRDALTGLRNRRALSEDLPALEASGPYAVALLDVDHFKAYNDLLGHLAGDNALRALATLVRNELRGGDVAYRYGGEELLLVLGGADLEVAGGVAERIRQVVAGASIPHPGGIGGVVTASIGVAAGTGDAGPLLAQADAALYAAKSGGRNRVGGAGVEHAAAPAPAAPALGRGLLLGLAAAARTLAEGRGAQALLEAVAGLVRSELRFATVVMNLRRADDTFETVIVLGDEHARAILLGQVSGWETWSALLDPRHLRCGAYWLPDGAHDWDDGVPVWMPQNTPAPSADAWLPEDALLAPLRDADGRLLAVMAVDEPLSGRRPSDAELELLMAVADHAGLLLSLVSPAAGQGSTGRVPTL